MNEQHFKKISNYLLGAVVAFTFCHLAWEYFNGGVLTHYLFRRADLPGISNWWGLIILPLLAWFSTVRIAKRISFNSETTNNTSQFPREIIIGFVGMLMVSILQSIAFTMGYSNITLYIGIAVLIIGLFLPLFRIECILGHVLGSTFIFGPVIPFVGVVMFATTSALSHYCIKPLLKRIFYRKSASV